MEKRLYTKPVARAMRIESGEFIAASDTSTEPASAPATGIVNAPYWNGGKSEWYSPLSE